MKKLILFITLFTALVVNAADKKITDLTLLPAASFATGDVLPIVDVSASETKKTRILDLDVRYITNPFTTTGDTVYYSLGVPTRLAIGSANTVYVSNGSAPTWALLTNSNLDAAAAIAYSKLNLTGNIVNADINASAGIVDTKLATISTAGKVSNSATTATSANTASAIVARDASGNFTAGIVTAALSGNATTATGFASNPTDCASNTYATTIDANGNLTCSTISVAGGGTGAATLTAHGVVVGNGTSAVNVTTAGSSGQCLMSNGASADPTFQTCGGGSAAPVTADEFYNGAVSNSASGGTLTIALKQADGSTDPSSGSAAVKVAMRSSTATSSVLNERSVTGALSQTITSGTTLGLASSTDTRLWFYLIDSDGSGTMKLGASTDKLDDYDLQSATKESATFTVTIASPGVVTETGHNRTNGDVVVLSTSGALPTGLAAATKYYVVSAASNTYSLSATPGGSAINTTGSQSGTHTVRVADTRLVSDGYYSSMPVRLIGVGTYNVTAGTWTAATKIASGTSSHFKPFTPSSCGSNSAATSIAGSGNFTIVPFDTIANDDLNQITTGSSWKWVCTKPGRWKFVANTMFGSASWSATQFHALSLYKNAGEVLRGPQTIINTNLTNVQSDHVDSEFSCVKGDYFDFRLGSGNGSSIGLNNNVIFNRACITWVGP